MKINEIIYADEIQSIDWNSIDLSSAEYFFSLDGQDIFKFYYAPHLFFLIQNEQGKVLAYAALEEEQDGYYPLVRIENIAKIKGLIMSIVFSLTMHKMKLIIKNTEELTPDGFLWISKLLSNGTWGLKLSDQDGNPLNLEKLRVEYERAKSHLRSEISMEGPTSILIENISHEKKIQWINEKNEKWKADTLLKPSYIFYNCEDLW